MDNSGYYDYAPTVSMTRSVVLGGMLSVPFREIGYELAALTGVRLIDLDHWLEHFLGRSLWDYRQSLKDPKIRLLEHQILQKALKSSPKSLIIAGEGTLSHQASLEAIRTNSALVFLNLPPMTAFQNTLDKIEEKGPNFFPYIETPLNTFDQILPLVRSLHYAEVIADQLFDMEVTSSRSVLKKIHSLFSKLSAS